ncbi:MAG TPA: ATP-binding protein [Ktedonobacteraceae bacterium]|nr:ATP-binding protein [Ktedonobacteraceae bacterium]
MAINDEERLRILIKSKLLDSGPEEVFDRFTQLAVALLDVPVSTVTLVDKDRQYFKSYYGIPEPWASRRQNPLSYSLCQYVVTSGQPLIVEDARKVAMLKENRSVTELDMIAYLGFPLLVADQALGSFCAIDTKPHHWSEREIEIVQELASYVDAELLLRIETLERQKILTKKLASYVDEELAVHLEKLERQKAAKQSQTSEQRLRALVNQIPIIIWQMDMNRAMTFLNAAWFTFTGLSEQESLGNGWISAIHPNDRAEILSSGKRPSGIPGPPPAEVRVQRADGVYREMVCHGRAYTDPQGVPLGYIGTMFNTTERKELERQWETFLGIVAHELKTPVTVIQGNTQLAQRLLKKVEADFNDRSPEQMQDTVSQVMSLLTRNIENLRLQTRQINELQDLSRVQVAQLDFHMTPCNLVELVQRVILDQRVVHPQRMVFFDPPGSAPILVMADEWRLQQVLVNYLTNAFKYSSAEQPVQVGITLADGSVRVWVRDYGIGLSSEQQQQIWKPFYQVQETSAPTSLSGLGLGLHICKALIQGQHGKVGVESAPGEGSTFWFTLSLLRT